MSDYDVIVIGSCTNAYVESGRFLTVHSNGERLTGAYAIGPEARPAAAGDTRESRARPARSAARHDPAVSEIIGDLHSGASTRREK